MRCRDSCGVDRLRRPRPGSGLAVGGLAGARAGQASDAALRDRVTQLVERLGLRQGRGPRGGRGGPDRSSARRSCRSCPTPATLPAGERKDRLEKLRAALRKAEDEINLGAAEVTLKGKGIRLTEAIQQLQKQTGNTITDIREQTAPR